MKHWIFDFDGTLVDSEGFFSESFRYALAPFQIKIGKDFIERIRYKHPHRIFEDFLTQEQSQIAFQRMDEVGQGIADKIQLFPGIVEILDSLEKQGASLSIWTGRDRHSTQTILKKQGVDSLFKKIMTGTCVENNKPSHDGLLQIQNFYKAQPIEMVMVGDHYHDIEPANQLGCFSIHAQWKQTPERLPQTITARENFKSTELLHQWILKNLKE